MLVNVPNPANDIQAFKAETSRAIAALASTKLGAGASPIFDGITFSGLTAARLVATDSTKAITSSDLVNWVTGTANRVTVTDDSDGTITLSGPQDIHTGASPTFADLTLSTPSNIYALSHDSFADFVADEHVAHSGISITGGGILSGGGAINANQTITLAHSDVDHDQTTNFIADEHIAHSGVTLTAGNGLTGGGDISASRSFAFDSTYSPTFDEITVTGENMIVHNHVGLHTDNDTQNLYAASNAYLDSGTWKKAQTDTSALFGSAGTGSSKGLFVYTSDDTTIGTISDWTERLAILAGAVARITGTLTVKTASDAGLQTIQIDQDDEDQAFIDFAGTSAADSSKNISTQNGDGSVEGPKNYASSNGWQFEGMVKVEVNGTARWMPYYSEDTA